ncbi:MAG: exodeoxyribonuclease subunit alpha [Pseudomonadota bacterium]
MNLNLPEPKWSRLDRAFARFFSQRCQINEFDSSELYALLAELSFQQNQGHSCIYLNSQQLQLIRDSGLACEIPNDYLELPTATHPLIIQHHCLYTHRYWFYEQRLALQLRQRFILTKLTDHFDHLLARYFPKINSEVIDWQAEAARCALMNHFAMISGGPGTGKTTTVIKILGLLLEYYSPNLQIALAAPTGKAAMRLQESIGIHIQNLPCSDTIKQQIPRQVYTIHRLLGALPPSPYFRYHADEPLPYDVVVIDEASMVDLALMSKLIDALLPESRLILLGDKDQLASVESGAVLADLTQALPQYTVELKQAYRFQNDIKQFAQAINQQNSEAAWELLKNDTVSIQHFTEDFIGYIAEQQSAYLDLIQQQADFVTIYRCFQQFQTLCATRLGYRGVIFINQAVEKQLAMMQKISLSHAWYCGRPIMIQQNNPSLNLYNGDIGICLIDIDQQLKVFFLGTEGLIHKILPARLPDCETVFAMTIHKSQGSEFERILMILPSTMNPILTKELIYTGITRAKKSLAIVTEEAIFKSAISQKIQRYGGLLAKWKV